MKMTERQAEVLSYILGLAPMGEPVQVKHKWLATDFHRMDHSNFGALVKAIIKRGAVEVVTTGIGATPSTLRVLKRPEAFEIIDGPCGYVKAAA